MYFIDFKFSISAGKGKQVNRLEKKFFSFSFETQLFGL